jgi:hypothetical protein
MLKKLLPILLLSLTYFIGQAYVWFDNEHYNAYGETSWIFDGSHAMPVSWNVKYLSEEINRILEAAAFLLMLKKTAPIYQLVGVEYFLYRVMDICFYFYNFKTSAYWLVFLIVGSIIAFIHYQKYTSLNEKRTYFR